MQRYSRCVNADGSRAPRAADGCSVDVPKRDSMRCGTLQQEGERQECVQRERTHHSPCTRAIWRVLIDASESSCCSEAYTKPDGDKLLHMHECCRLRASYPCVRACISERGRHVHELDESFRTTHAEETSVSNGAHTRTRHSNTHTQRERERESRHPAHPCTQHAHARDCH